MALTPADVEIQEPLNGHYIVPPELRIHPEPLPETLTFSTPELPPPTNLGYAIDDGPFVDDSVPPGAAPALQPPGSPVSGPANLPWIGWDTPAFQQLLAATGTARSDAPASTVSTARVAGNASSPEIPREVVIVAVVLAVWLVLS